MTGDLIQRMIQSILTVELRIQVPSDDVEVKVNGGDKN
jgi:hypothetical protein